MTEYSFAPEVAAIGRAVIDRVPEYAALEDVRIEWVWRDKASKHHGRIVLGTARKITGLNALLGSLTDDESDRDPGEAFFVIEVARDMWGDLTEAQRRALVDHELAHLHVGYDDNDERVLGLVGHDVEEFASIIERHGLWRSDVKAFATVAAEQLRLAVVTPDGEIDPPSRRQARRRPCRSRRPGRSVDHARAGR